MGLTAVGAASVGEARRRLTEFDVQVLLLDIRLGAMSGLEFLEDLRGSDDTRPAVLMTAYADVPSVQRALRCDAVDYITKPFTLMQLERALSRACQRVSMRRRTDPLAPDDAALHAAGPASVDSAKRRALLTALHRAKGNKLRAAEELGISRRTLYNWLHRYGG